MGDLFVESARIATRVVAILTDAQLRVVDPTLFAKPVRIPFCRAWNVVRFLTVYQLPDSSLKAISTRNVICYHGRLDLL